MSHPHRWIQVDGVSDPLPGDVVASATPKDGFVPDPKYTVLFVLASDVIRMGDLGIMQRSIEGVSVTWLRVGERDRWVLYRKEIPLEPTIGVTT